MTPTRRSSPTSSGHNASTPQARQPAAQLAEFRSHQGARTLFVAGKPHPALLMDLTSDASTESIRASAGQGMHLYRLRNVDLGWTSAKEADFAALDARLRDLLDVDPDASFLLSVSVDAPVWWLRAHPGECVAYCLPDAKLADAPPLQSWASARWRSEAGEALNRLMTHLGSVENRARCLGVEIEAGEDGAWRYPHLERLPDIGSRMTERFREFALEKYRRNTGLLRKAWFDARAEFDAITCPNATERRKTDLGVFRNPTRSRRLLDYYECLCAAHSAAALHFCALVKRATGGNALVGLPGWVRWDQRIYQEEGHWFPEPIFDSPDVDFFIAPLIGDGVGQNALAASLALREKFLFLSLPADASPEAAALRERPRNVGLTVQADSSIETLRAVVASAERDSRTPAAAPKRPGPLAVIVDFAGILYVSHASAPEGWINDALVGGQLRELERLGTPFDLYLLSDLFQPRLPDYKVFLFLNTFYLTEAERRRVDARIKRSGQTAVWLWGPGLIGEERIGAELGQQLCGQKLRLEDHPTSLRVRIVEPNDPLIGGFQVGATFGDNRPASPTITVADRSVVRLGANTANKTVFAVQRFNHWTSLVFGTFPVPTTLLRNVLRASNNTAEKDIL